MGERWPRIVLHADMDAFYAAVEQLDAPALRGRPVLVGGIGKRSVVSTASYEARPFGVGSAMPMETARRKCPEAVIVPPRFERYQELSCRVMGVFGDFSPAVEPLSLDEAFLEMTGAEEIFGPPARMCRALKREVVRATGGLTISVGAAATKFVAKVASDHRKPDGYTVVPPDETRAFLDPLPLERLWGVGPKTRARLEVLGMRTIGEVAQANEALLSESFGALGERLFHLSRGEDPRRVNPERKRKSVSAEYTLEEDIAGLESVMVQIRRAAERVGRSLRRKGLKAGGVRVKLKTTRFRTLTRQAPLVPPTDTTRTLVERGRRLLDDLDLDQPLRLVGLGAFDLSAADRGQIELFADPARERQQSLDETLDSIRERFGDRVVKRGID